MLRTLAPPADEPQRGHFEMLRGWQRYDDIDPARIDEVLRALADGKVMQCPTLAVWDGLAEGVLAEERDEADPRLASIPEFLQQMWKQPGYLAFGRAVMSVLPAKHALVGRMHDLGVPMMIGTDLGNPYVFPGSSVHEEMLAFQSAGIPAADVLRMATSIPARFCGAEDRLGGIKEGMTASLILLTKDPLEDVRHVAAIEAVVLRGRVFDRAALDQMRRGTAPAPTNVPNEAE